MLLQNRGARKWGLAPAFDVNPAPDEGTTLKTALSELHGNALEVEAVIEAAPFFDVEADEDASIASTMATLIKSEWKAIGAKAKMTSADFRACRNFIWINGTVGWARTTDLLFHRQAL